MKINTCEIVVKFTLIDTGHELDVSKMFAVTGPIEQAVAAFCRQNGMAGSEVEAHCNSKRVEI